SMNTQTRMSLRSCGLRCSLPPKHRLPALIEREHAFPAVFGSDQAIVGLDLECEAVPHRHLQAAMNGLLGLTHRERTVGGNAPGHAKRGLQKVRWFDHPIDEPPCFRLSCGEGKARQDQLLCAALADGAGQ